MAEPVGRRIRFTADFDYHPTRSITIAYKDGMVQFVRRECADQAIAAGKAVPTTIAVPPSGLCATLARLGKRGAFRNDTSRRSETPADIPEGSSDA